MVRILVQSAALVVVGLVCWAGTSRPEVLTVSAAEAAQVQGGADYCQKWYFTASKCDGEVTCMTNSKAAGTIAECPNILGVTDTGQEALKVMMKNVVTLNSKCNTCAGGTVEFCVKTPITYKTGQPCAK
jgi:hypothetical protein